MNLKYILQSKNCMNIHYQGSNPNKFNGKQHKDLNFNQVLYVLGIVISIN